VTRPAKSQRGRQTDPCARPRDEYKRHGGPLFLRWLTAGSSVHPLPPVCCSVGVRAFPCDYRDIVRCEAAPGL